MHPTTAVQWHRVVPLYHVRGSECDDGHIDTDAANAVRVLSFRHHAPPSEADDRNYSLALVWSIASSDARFAQAFSSRRWRRRSLPRRVESDAHSSTSVFRLGSTRLIARGSGMPSMSARLTSALFVLAYSTAACTEGETSSVSSCSTAFRTVQASVLDARNACLPARLMASAYLASQGSVACAWAAHA